MRELSIEEKAKRYDEALGRTKAWCDCEYATTDDKILLKRIFPELRESEDEMIRKEILEYFQQFKNEGLRGINISDWIAWLEKQGEQKRLDFPYVTGWRENRLDNKPQIKHSVLMLTTHGVAEGEWLGEEWCQYRWSCKVKDADVLYWIHLSDLESLEKENFEQKPIDANEEDNDFTIYHPIKNECSNKYECFPYSFYGSIEAFHNNEELLYFLRNCFYKKEDCEKWCREQNEQKPADKVEPKFKVGDIIKPKDRGHEPWQIMQVDILDKKYRFKDGYVIHFSQEDNYELVEQKPAWSEDDERMIDTIISDLERHGGKEGSCYSTEINFLKSLKDRVGCEVNCTTTKEWSEEDKMMLQYAIEHFEHQKRNCVEGGGRKKAMQEFIDWLKSLRPQSKWKPSGFHLECIEDAISLYEKRGINAIGLKEILDELKKLKE